MQARSFITVELARVLRDSIQNLSSQLDRTERVLSTKQETVVKQTKYSAAIREIQMAILELKFSMTRLQESLDITSNGKLSSVLINLEEMYVYYTIATVHTVAYCKNIRLFIEIPLKAADIL
jgi:hypothetical protein